MIKHAGVAPIRGMRAIRPTLTCPNSLPATQAKGTKTMATIAQKMQIAHEAYRRGPPHYGAIIQKLIEDTVAETDQLRSEIERLRAAISSLIDAIQDVQCWQGTHVGACIDQACALLPNEPDQGRR
jgi:uncharacterized coiled-coil protein SlyX